MVLRELALTVLGRIALVIGIAAAFTFGLVGAVYISLHSSETSVPDVVGQDRLAAEKAISKAHLNFRVRATRPASDAKADTVLVQTPRAGEIVKVGQTVAVDISRAAQQGESTASSVSDGKQEIGRSEGANERPDAGSANENKARRLKTSNKNANGNANGNASSNASSNANSNANTGSRNANRADSNNAEKRVVDQDTGVPKPAALENTNRRPVSSSANTNAPSERSRPSPKPTP